MTPELKLRLLVALAIGLLLGLQVRSRAKARLTEWTEDAAAAQASTIERLKRGTSGTAFVGAGILCVGIVFVVELVVSVLQHA